ncbi:hypothetical protein KP509_37G005900 [Ceratopteris richardii]|nr:hypothetical protein KP509_37G005900 [Ceratopteris richardii]
MRVEELRIGEIYKGKISMVESYGIFVDIGTHTDGFIHISRLGISSLKQGLENALRVGEVVTVQIIDIDPVTDSISLVLADENALYQTVDLQPIMLPEREILKRVTIRRAKKAPQLLVPSRRRIMTLEARQRLKTHKRAVMAEQQAFQLHLARLKTGISQNTQSITAMDDSG